MSDPAFFILYVKDPLESAAFYADLLGHATLEASPGFAMFKLASGVMLGLWAKHTVQPPAFFSGCSAEVAFVVSSDDELGQQHAQWVAKGLPIAQAPTRMDFGYTFVALDPDGHRLRVFSPS
jgi:predicted enzyme related to lactoylglutathione lyase